MKRFKCKYCDEETNSVEAIWDEIAEQWYCPWCGYPALEELNDFTTDKKSEI